jgi:enamine deaminase RidA (YjgF/YER057c/UK114 family)
VGLLSLGDGSIQQHNPPTSEVIGVAALAQPDIVGEIVAVAALPD